MSFIKDLKEKTCCDKYYTAEISEKAEQLIDNILDEIQKTRESLSNDIRNGNLPLETYDLDDRCKDLMRKEELMYYILDKTKWGVLREDIIETLIELDKPIETVAEHLEENSYILHLKEDEYDLALMKATEKYKELDFEKE